MSELRPITVAFEISEWLDEHVPESFKRRAVAILDDAPDFRETVKEAFVLGKTVSADAHRTELMDLQAQVEGLRTALQRANAVTVSIGTKGTFIAGSLFGAALVLEAIVLYFVFQ